MNEIYDNNGNLVCENALFEDLFPNWIDESIHESVKTNDPQIWDDLLCM